MRHGAATGRRWYSVRCHDYCSNDTWYLRYLETNLLDADDDDDETLLRQKKHHIPRLQIAWHKGITVALLTSSFLLITYLIFPSTALVSSIK